MSKKNLNFKTAEEYAAAHEEFFKSHPDAPLAKDVECLNLIMRREYAEQILAGTKKLEFRQYSDFYVKRLIDPDVADYICAHIDDDEVVVFCNDIRQVKKIHFHNYNNSWFLDVECDFNDAFSITKKDISYLQERYGCHDFDAELEMYEKANIEKRPWLFYFVCGKVLDTNLEVKSKKEKTGKQRSKETAKSSKPTRINTNKEELRIITFKVGKEEYESIESGRKGVFTKGLNKSNLSTFLITNKDRTVKEINGIPQLRPYDAIQFTNKENSYTCQIDDAEVVYMDYESGKYRFYKELEEDEREDITEYMIGYLLGDKI